jgi:hypothetical protein
MSLVPVHARSQRTGAPPSARGRSAPPSVPARTARAAVCSLAECARGSRHPARRLLDADAHTCARGFCRLRRRCPMLLQVPSRASQRAPPCRCWATWSRWCSRCAREVPSGRWFELNGVRVRPTREHRHVPHVATLTRPCRAAAARPQGPGLAAGQPGAAADGPGAALAASESTRRGPRIVHVAAALRAWAALLSSEIHAFFTRMDARRAGACACLRAVLDASAKPLRVTVTSTRNSTGTCFTSFSVIRWLRHRGRRAHAPAFALQPYEILDCKRAGAYTKSCDCSRSLAAI